MADDFPKPARLLRGEFGGVEAVLTGILVAFLAAAAAFDILVIEKDSMGKGKE